MLNALSLILAKEQKMKFLIGFALIALLNSCGGDDSTSECSSGCLGHGFSQQVTEAEVSISLQNGGADEQFAIIPFVLGSDDVNGTSSEVVATVGKSDTVNLNNSRTKRSTQVSFDQYDHMMRRVYNSYSYKSITNRPHQILEQLHKLESMNAKVDGLFPTTQRPFNARKAFSFLAKHAKPKKKMARATVATACPEFLDLEAVGVEENIDLPDIENSDNNGEFCIAVIGEESQTIPDIEEIKASIATAYGNYKLMYDSLFDQSVDDFQFKPVFVLLPFDSATYWPGGQGEDAPLSGVTGAYFHQLSVDNDRPILILPTNLKKVNDALTDAEAVAKYHATLAHELQHAILDYYRYWVNGDQEDAAIEIGSLDEGLAHFMESVNGYANDTFDSFTSLFLQRTIAAPTAILDDNDSPVNRGAAHSLFHYMVSQEGGITFKDGTVDHTEASPGITFLRVWVKGKYHGVKGLFDAYGKSKMDTIGNFVGALMVDGATNTSPLPIFQNQQIIDDVTDTSGQNNKTFGLRFNNFREVPDLQDRLDSFTSFANLEQQSISLNYYLPQPLLYTTTSSDETINLSFASEVESRGITVVRVK